MVIPSGIIESGQMRRSSSIIGGEMWTKEFLDPHHQAIYK